MRTTRTMALVGAVGLAAVSAVVSAVSAAGPASAHGAPYTVTAGSAPAGTSVAVTLTTTGSSPQFVFKDTTTGTQLTCASVVLKGAVTTGTTGARVGTIDGARSVFNTCTGPFGLQMPITGYGTWTLDVSDATSGVSTITVGNVRAHMKIVNGPRCEWDFAAPTGTFTSADTGTTDPGSLTARYTNSSHQFAVPATAPGSLGLWNVKAGSGGTQTYCWARSVYSQGDRISWSATWNATADTAAYNPVAIT